MTGSGAPMPRAEAARLLGVDVDAGPEEVQRAYLRAARRTHPDVLPGLDEVARRAAGDAFARITRARDLLLIAEPVDVPDGSGWVVRPGWEDGPRYRRVEGRGLGGSLVVLVLLAFLLVALVTTEQALRGDPAGDPPATTSTR